MDTLALPLEHRKADEKRALQDSRAIAKFGHGSTTGGMAVARRFTTPLAQALKNKITHELEHGHKSSAHYGFVYALQALPVELVALACIQISLHSIGQAEPLRDTAILLGRHMSQELWVARLRAENPKLAERIEKAVRERHSSFKQRTQAFRSAAKRGGYQLQHWKRAEQLNAGWWLIDVMCLVLPDVFERVADHEGQVSLTLAEGALKVAEDAMREMMLAHPVMQPLEVTPPAWTGFFMSEIEGSVAFNVGFLRAIHKETIAEAKVAIRSGQMKPALDAVTSLQSVPWQINHRVLDVMRECVTQGLQVKGLPPVKELPMPLMPKPWDDMSEGDRKLWKWRKNETKKLNRSYVGERILFAEDMVTAERMAQHERFFTPMNCDWRGRVYGLCHFNFQREDRVRGLFRFADGEPIGEEGLWWLKVHVANCGDFDKISKRPMKERVAWTDARVALLTKLAAEPLAPPDFIGPTLEKMWLAADQPFLFLAACQELAGALAAGPTTFVTTLPVSFDGSCSGLQHLAAMTRASEGSLVNLTAQETPQDVYQSVAEIVKARVAAEDTPLAKAWLDYGIDRKVVKRNVMTYSYSSKKFGMAAQQEEDLITPLGFEVLQGKLEEHPFSHWASKPHRDAPSPAATYIAKHCYAGIETIVQKPAEAMGFLQKLAKALAHEGKPVKWVTPIGLPWSNRYHEPVTNTVVLWMHDKGVKTRHRMLIAEGSKKEIDKNRAANGIAPNFVHALDAAHLMLVTNAWAKECAEAGVACNIATVHDSFGCLASRAGRFNKIIREEFVRMYETHDVLHEVFEQAKCDLTLHNWQRLPEEPTKGPLNIKEVLDAEYCFA